MYTCSHMRKTPAAMQRIPQNVKKTHFHLILTYQEWLQSRWEFGTLQLLSCIYYVFFPPVMKATCKCNMYINENKIKIIAQIE